MSKELELIIKFGVINGLVTSAASLVFTKNKSERILLIQAGILSGLIIGALKAYHFGLTEDFLNGSLV